MDGGGTHGDECNLSNSLGSSDHIGISGEGECTDGNLGRVNDGWHPGSIDHWGAHGGGSSESFFIGRAIYCELPGSIFQFRGDAGVRVSAAADFGDVVFFDVDYGDVGCVGDSLFCVGAGQCYFLVGLDCSGSNVDRDLRDNVARGLREGAIGRGDFDNYGLFGDCVNSGAGDWRESLESSLTDSQSCISSREESRLP